MPPTGAPLPIEMASASLSPPPRELDPYLDAAARCFARHGVSRTRVPDVAAELGVSRVTVYRRIGTVEAMRQLLLAREVHRILEMLPAVVAGLEGPELIVTVVETVVTHALDHPVLAKVLADDPKVIGPVLTSSLSDLIDRGVAGTAPVVEAAMDAGHLAAGDARALTELLVRLTVTLVLAPPDGPLRPFLDQLLLPALTPEVPREP
jgi:AcrR family transcriptional regulator